MPAKGLNLPSSSMENLVDSNYVQSFIDECNKVYQEAWLVKVNDLLARSPTLKTSDNHIEKRSITDVIFGGVVSNFIGILYEQIVPWSDHNRIKELQTAEHIIEARLSKFNQDFNTTLAIQRGIIDLVKNNARSIREQNRQLGYFKELSQKLTWLSSYIQTRILFSATDLRTVNDELVHRRVATSELADLFNLTDLHQINPINTEFISVTSPAKDTLKFKFSIRKSSLTSKVYRIYAFRYRDNLTHTPVMKDYHGPQYILYNQNINCIKGLDDIIERVVYDDCNTANYIDPSVKRWRSYATHDIHEQDLSNYKRTPHYNYIYCFPYEIKIGNSKYRCPTLPFKLSTTVPFQFRNQSYTPQVRRIKISHIEHLFFDDISSLHFDNLSIATSDAIFFDRIQELIQKNEQLMRSQEYSATVAEHGVTWWITVTIVFLVGLAIFGLIVININLSQKLHKQNIKVASDVAEIKNYEPISCVNCQKSSIHRPPTIQSLKYFNTDPQSKKSRKESDEVPLSTFGGSPIQAPNPSDNLKSIREQIYDIRKSRIA